MHGAPAWVTVKVCPPAVIVAVREAVLVFVATENATVPFPLPLAPEVTVTHAAELVAVHGHPDEAVTEKLPVPPLAATDWLVGDNVYVHGAAD